ncbi:gamma-aminobutyric acid type B receptor subunit 2-like isoform X1 [Asterias amurensis]|uniref:gamma-aminobutyric acid type B receptor subunit 2-like isoform X1 n=1 Tax=Asterias amurensis TaxID=7602 RepID=UPI003AB67BE9
MGWRRVAFIYEESQQFAEQMEIFRLILEANDMQVVLSERVKDLSKFDFHLQSIKRQDARIIFTGFFQHELLKLFCQAYISGVYGAKYVWVAPGWANNAFWLNAPQSVIDPCTQEQITSAVNSTLLFNGNPRRVQLDEVNFNGVKPLPEHYQYYNNEFPDDTVLYYTYDGIIAVALALNASIADLQRLDPPRRLEDFSYSDDEMARVILKNADNLDFTGLLGKFLIERGQRQGERVYIQQAQGEHLETVMVYETNSQQLLNYGDTGIKWQGGHVPVDGVTKQEMTLEISWKTRAVVFSLASFGSTMALVFLFIDIRFKNKRAIKMSSPSLSNLTVVGCLFLYTSVFALGWDKTNLPDSAIVIKCHVERMLVSVGLSLAFGSVFMKTYRIHVIFSQAVKRFKKIDLPDWKLICGVLVIAFLDCFIFIAWIALDTTTVYRLSLEQMLNETEPERELFIVPVIQYCSSKHDIYFTLVLYGVKGVLLAFGLFLAWETRNICISQLNDSKHIAASLYIVALTVALIVPTLTIVGDDVNMMFAIPGVAIVIVNTCVLLLNFIPKIRLLLTSDETRLRVSMMTPQGYGEPLASDKSVDQTNKLCNLRMDLEQKRARLRQLVKIVHQAHKWKTSSDDQ